MTQTITLKLPDDAAQRYQRGAIIARKRLDEFLVERLVDVAPPLADDLPFPLDEELKSLEELNDEALWGIARSRLSPRQQGLYDDLLQKNSQGSITDEEKEKLQVLGQEARRLTLKKAHAFMFLKWRGHQIPTLDQLRDAE